MDSQEPSIFTRIMQGEIPSYRVCEDDVVYSMLDINPLSDGHVLVIPRQQVASLWELDVETYSRLWATAYMLARHMQKVLQPQRVGVVVEGFEVPHAHIHLVPLYDKTVLQLHHGYPVHSEPDQLADIAQQLAQGLQ